MVRDWYILSPLVADPISAIYLQFNSFSFFGIGYQLMFVLLKLVQAFPNDARFALAYI